ncbi:MAG TPA: urease accessory protein UreE [Syntrophomonadaceae bacterium]|nr:urease accessory protein UreE [Syntrophomonadaceae bacterium]
MIIEKILGSIMDRDMRAVDQEYVDYVPIDWYQVRQKVLHKVSRKGAEVGIRNPTGAPLRQGDILWQDAKQMLVVEILPCECLALHANSVLEMGKACYEIGNRHAPLFFEDGELLTPYDQPLMTVLCRCGFSPVKKIAILKNPLGGHESGHSHSHEA